MNETQATNTSGPKEAEPLSRPWPKIFNRYLDEVGSDGQEILPRRVTKKFHGEEVTGWSGKINVNDIQGYVENKRLKIFLNRWRNKRRDPAAVPSTEEIYRIMLDADEEEPRDDKKLFHVERMANNIKRNGVQEEIIVFVDSAGQTWLWDGNRRFFGTLHIMKEAEFAQFRGAAQWIPSFLIETTGDPYVDKRRKHSILTETNFVKKDSISWPTYIKAEEIWEEYHRRILPDPTDSTLRREVKAELAQEYGLKGWRQAERWIKMVDLAKDFKGYQEEEKDRDADTVDLKLQDKFEYFDELSKPGVWGVLEKDVEARDKVFNWLWDDKFKSFAAVRKVPAILADPVARDQANADDPDGVEKAINTVIANDPTRVKDKRGADAKIAQFAEWLDSFKREDFKQLSRASLGRLKQILEDICKILEGLLAEAPTEVSNEK
jgi:hypothetical protein